MPPPRKANIYIDGSNLYGSLRSQAKRTDLDFLAFARKLAHPELLQRIYYYNSTLDPQREPERARAQQGFYEQLRQTEYLELRLGQLVYRNWPATPAYEKGIDVKLAVDMLVHGFRNNYDVAILVSGDADFCDALQAVKDMGLHTEVALFHPTGSRPLRRVADRVIPVDQEFLGDCWLGP